MARLGASAARRAISRLTASTSNLREFNSILPAHTATLSDSVGYKLIIQYIECMIEKVESDYLSVVNYDFMKTKRQKIESLPASKFCTYLPIVFSNTSRIAALAMML